MKNWRLIENPNLDKGMVYDFYESSEVNEVLIAKDREISRLNKLIKKCPVDSMKTSFKLLMVTQIIGRNFARS